MVLAARLVTSAEGPPLREFPFKHALTKWKGKKSGRKKDFSKVVMKYD